MSKIGRKPVAFKTAKVEIKDKKVLISGAKVKVEHELPAFIDAKVDGKSLILHIANPDREGKMQWGLHRALLANKIKGAEAEFERKVSIVGLGFKAQAAGNKMTFTLGYTHKIDFNLPKEVSVEIDRTGQFLTFKSADKFALGNVCDTVRSFRPPEPYKGTGIIREGDVVIRKAGKTKASA